MILLIKPEGDFLQFLLFPDLKKQYKEEIKNELSKIEKKYHEANQKLIKQKNEAIELDKHHRSLLNACIFPFSQDDSLQKYGYVFLMASPLKELNISNLDFLLIDQNTPLNFIFGEAKSSIEDEGRVIEEFIERIKNIDNNNEHIKGKYARGITFEKEFVIGVNFTEASKISKSIIRRKQDIKVWNIGRLYDDFPIMKLEIPYDEDRSKVINMKHKNNQFNKIISKSIQTSFSFKSVYLESHPIAKLSLLIITKKDQENNFTYQDIFDIVREEYDYLNDYSIIMSETNKILRLGEEIGFIKQNNVDGKNKFKIISKYKSQDSQEMELKNKWIDFSIEKDKDKEFSLILEQIQEKFSKYRKERKTITDYTNSQH